MMKKVMTIPEKWNVFKKQLNLDLEQVGLNSLGIVMIISFFVGGVVSIQTSLNMSNPLLPKYLVGWASRDSLILEFSPTMISLILAGKVGSSIASEIGSMRISEQIDALEIMGVNSASFLILPKIIASVLSFPFLVIISMGIGMLGAWIGGLTRPLTHDLFKSMGDKFNIVVQKIVIHTLIEGIFHSSFHCKHKDTGEEAAIDARTSDAIAIAIRYGCPIFTYENILSRAGIIINSPRKEDKTGVEDLNLQEEDDKMAEPQGINTFSLKKLKKMLNKAIEDEDYEKASEIRDEIKKREGK